LTAVCSAFLVGGWYHVCHFRTPATRWMDYYYIPGFLLWGLDRLARAVRTLYANRRAPPASLELLSPDTVRLTLARGVRWRAGQHAYVLLPGTAGVPSEAHPFTIAGAPDALDGTRSRGERSVSFIIRARGGATRRLLERAKAGERSVPALIDGPYGAPPDLSSFSTVILVAGMRVPTSIRGHVLIVLQADPASRTPWPCL
jgi:ferric-chelate reductase